MADAHSLTSEGKKNLRREPGVFVSITTLIGSSAAKDRKRQRQARGTHRPVGVDPRSRRFGTEAELCGSALLGGTVSTTRSPLFAARPSTA